MWPAMWWLASWERTKAISSSDCISRNRLALTTMIGRPFSSRVWKAFGGIFGSVSRPIR